MEPVDFTKPTVAWDVILIVEDKKLYCNRALLSIWSPFFETMFKADFKEKDSLEIELNQKHYDDIYELLQIIYPPNKPITALNCQKVLELADEFQINELNKRCRQFLLQQRGTLDILLLAQKYNFDDVIKRCSDHLKHTINSKILTEDTKIKDVNVETMNSLLVARCRHLENLVDTFKKKVAGACEKFRDIRSLPGYDEESSNCSRHPDCIETCQDCMRNVRMTINKLCEEGRDLTE